MKNIVVKFILASALVLLGALDSQAALQTQFPASAITNPPWASTQAVSQIISTSQIPAVNVTNLNQTLATSSVPANVITNPPWINTNSGYAWGLIADGTFSGNGGGLTNLNINNISNFPTAWSYTAITNPPWCTTGAVSSIISTSQIPAANITNPTWLTTQQVGGIIATSQLPSSAITNPPWLDTNAMGGILQTSKAPYTLVTNAPWTTTQAVGGIILTSQIPAANITNAPWVTTNDSRDLSFSGSNHIGNQVSEGTGVASGQYSHAEGESTIASGLNSHAEGESTEATNEWAHAEGAVTKAYGQAAHAEGLTTQATGNGSHAEGELTEASGPVSHAEGESTIASGSYSHSAGRNSQATNDSTWVWSDGTAFGSTTTAQFSAYASNGFRFFGGSISGNGNGLTNLNPNNVTNAPWSLLNHLHNYTAITNPPWTTTGAVQTIIATSQIPAINITNLDQVIQTSSVSNALNLNGTPASQYLTNNSIGVTLNGTNILGVGLISGQYNSSLINVTNTINGRVIQLTPTQLLLFNTNSAGLASYQLNNAGTNFSGRVNLVSSTGGTITINSEDGSGTYSGTVTASNFVGIIDAAKVTNAPWLDTNAMGGILQTSKAPYTLITNAPWTTTGAVGGIILTSQLPNTVITNSPWMLSNANLQALSINNGFNVTNLNATNLTGSVGLAQLPNTVITNTGTGTDLSLTNTTLINGTATNITWAGTFILTNVTFIGMQIVYAVTNVSANYTVSTNDNTINCLSNSFNVTLPTAVGIEGYEFDIKNSGNGTITILTTGGQTVDGNASGVPKLNRMDDYTLRVANTNWMIR